MSRLIIVSNRLPFSIDKTGDEITIRQSSGGLVSALKSYFEKDTSQHFDEKIWVGASDTEQGDWEKAKDVVKNEDFTVYPVFIEKEVYENYYNGFSNSTLWPLFHYFPTLVTYDKKNYNDYVLCNSIFTQKILEIIQPGDVIWIHDYQLMLMPEMVRNQAPDTTIGFFLHIPFPSYEIFRMLPTLWKKTILNGLLGADLIGFHTYDYMHHFIQSVKMVLEVENNYNTITYDNRIIKTDLFPIGIDFKKFQEHCNNSNVSAYEEDIHKNFGNKKIIFSVDRLDYTKGLTNRLEGYEIFLEQHPEWREKVVFIFNIVPSRDVIPSYSERKKLVAEKVSTINGKYSTLGWQPLMYRYNHLGFDELCAHYRTADVALITPLRDGMNLVAKEYVAGNNSKGILILSELTGAASELNEAILVNPTDTQAVSDAIAAALVMPDEEKQLRMQAMQKRLSDYDVVSWVNDFLGELQKAKIEQEKLSVKWLNNKVIKAMRSDYGEAARRCIMLDYDGTLAPYTKLPSQASPGVEVIDFLSKLAADERNEVVVISGRDSDTLDKWLGHLNINFVAEHGAFIKYKNQNWQTLVRATDNWKARVRPLLDLFVTRCAGSLVEEKKNSISWHYRNTHPGLGFIRSRELLNNIVQMTGNMPIQVIDGKKVIEVRLMGIDKGNTALKIIDHFRPEFILCIGDDATDEDMFKALEQIAHTIKIGQDSTAAQFSIQSQAEVLPFLKKLTAPPNLIYSYYTSVKKYIKSLVSSG